MAAFILLIIVGLVVFFALRSRRGGVAGVAVRQAQERVRAGADRTETFAELVAELEASPAVSPAVRDALRAAIERMPGAAVVLETTEVSVTRTIDPALPVSRTSRKQKKAAPDMPGRVPRFGHGSIGALEPLAAFDARPPLPALKKRRPLAIQSPREPLDARAAHAARS